MRAYSSFGLSVCLLMTASAWAATPEDPPKNTEKPASTSAEPKTSVLLDEITVSARKRAAGEAAQDTPLSVSAFSGEQFDAIFAQNLDDLGQLVPNVSFKQTTQVGVQNFMIRGMGVTGTTPSDEPAVGIFQDGVYWGVNYGAALDTFDVESVEVLRGPQGTLFGRNVTGGAILVRTKRPTGEFGYAGQATFGNFGRMDFSGRIEGPVNDKLALKLAVIDRRHDGYFNNLTTGKDFGDQHSTIYRGTAVLKPSDATEATLILERYKQTGASMAAVGIEIPGNSPYNAGFRQQGDLWDVQFNRPGTHELTTNMAVLDIRWELPKGLVTSITGYREIDDMTQTDFDGTPYDYFTTVVGMDQDQLSQELLFSSKLGGRFNFTTGLYYFEQQFKASEARDLNLGATRTVTRAELNQDSYAAFGEMDIGLSDTWTLTLGGRYSNETKKARTAPFASIAATCADNSIFGFDDCNFVFGNRGKTSWSDFSPKVVLGYKPNADQLAYGSITRGFRSGGYSMRGNQLLSPFDAEEVTAYEVGYKSNWNDGKVRLNTAVYMNKYKDLQRTVLGVDPVFGTLQSTFNVADATIQGLELDVSAQVAPGLVLSLGYGYTDASYDSARNNFDITKRFVRVPENTGSAAVTYDHPIQTGGSVGFRASASYTGDYFFNDANTLSQSAYTLYDASVGYTAASGHWTVSLFGENLTNEQYSIWGATLGALGHVNFVGNPRTYGLRMTYDYR